MSQLEVLHEGRVVLRLPLLTQSLRIGKSPANDLALVGDDLPAVWCSIDREAGDLVVRDRSGRGVTVNAQTRPSHALVDGDRLSLGQLDAVYRAASPMKRPRTARVGRTSVLRTRASGQLEEESYVLCGPDGTRTPVAAGIRVGGDDENDIVVDDGFTSGFHAQLSVTGGRLVVRDLGSTNGTLVDGVRVREAEVRAGQTIAFGRAAFLVEGSTVDATPPEPTGNGPWSCDALMTKDAKFARVFAMIEKVASHDVTVCVFGETGTGKELASRAMHTLSPRADGPFVPLNCAAIPHNLIESELFGHERGAFTGADRQRAGAFEQAHGGTLFLDEVGELPLEVQAKLLRVLENRTVRRLGGKAEMHVDVRVVAATHRNLVKHVEEGKFREDLLHRLYVVPINLPALRDRPKDIEFLARALAKKMSPAGEDVLFTKPALRKLKKHRFMGNVRELRNVVQQALVLGNGRVIDADDFTFLPTSLGDATAQAQQYNPSMSLEDVERQHIAHVLDVYGNASEAARVLGMAKTTFWRKVKLYGLET